MRANYKISLLIVFYLKHEWQCCVLHSSTEQRQNFLKYAKVKCPSPHPKPSREVHVLRIWNNFLHKSWSAALLTFLGWIPRNGIHGSRGINFTRAWYKLPDCLPEMVSCPFSPEELHLDSININICVNCGGLATSGFLPYWSVGTFFSLFQTVIWLSLSNGALCIPFNHWFLVHSQPLLSESQVHGHGEDQVVFGRVHPLPMVTSRTLQV